MPTWLFLSITGGYNCWICPLGYFLLTGIYSYWTVLAPWCHSVPSQSCPSQFWLRSSNQSRTDLSFLKPFSESFLFTLTSNLDITKDTFLCALFSWSGIKPVHLISSQGRLILGGLWDLIVSRPWCLSRSNIWILRLLSWVQCPGPQLTTFSISLCFLIFRA